MSKKNKIKISCSLTHPLLLAARDHQRPGYGTLYESDIEAVLQGLLDVGYIFMPQTEYDENIRESYDDAYRDAAEDYY